MRELLGDWKFWSMLISATALILSITIGIFNRLISNRVTDKIQNNEIKHLQSDIEILKTNQKELQVEIREDLNKIFRRLGRIEKNQAKRDAVCDERHKQK